MKKFLAVFLIAATALTVFAGCSEEEEESGIQLASDPIESYDTVSVFLPEDEESTEGASDSNEENKETQSEVAGFVIKEKKFRYGEQDIVLLNIENKTGKDYTLTVNGTYFDESGNVLRNETQSFEDFVAGYQGYFVFHPEMAFESFSFSLDYVEFEGAPRLSNIKGLAWDYQTANYNVWPEIVPGQTGDPENVLYTKWSVINENNITLHVKVMAIAFDSKGEIICIRPTGYKEYPAGAVGGMDIELYKTMDDITTDIASWPKSMQEGITLITVPMDAMTVEEFRAWEATVRG